ncbi:adenosylmethionine--8-amino-7-oxononanoate transaminase [Corynebacterium sp. sy017]|uniref:adenosylmethionine--8-amino-7-oxononanoate transaminase n=1 Tax=unclassified Corynebacterium TaxID=2624378 RepID=UPI001184FC1F|nr:adenosylmethionine--8-amino-7-oxononanoate transaminase [Corynebacterium sp. SY003]MBP3087561.1 adenosylmethionine--8-amino-7-oxononanoate transaminase [Corynebacterium sp. sy017]TSD92707.1 adenosylmethionine--8-amino-7-oxononanoate transaminase [Corynebacterium sp. SY003]
MWKAEPVDNDSIALVQFDQQHIWHPYSSSPAKVDPLFVHAASGVYLQLSDGTQLIDAMSSWWAAAHGHSHPHLVAAAHQQIDQMSHVMFGGLTHRPAIELAQKLIELTDSALTKVFFSDSGSVAVEVALKICFQYALAMGKPERKKILTWRRGYHGDTFATMSLCDPDTGMHSMWGDLVMEHIFAPQPPAQGSDKETIDDYLTQFESLVDQTTAGVIIEPIVQGAGGMRFHDAEIVQGIRRICDKHKIVFIADEIATGFGRTGALFATQGAGVCPDILCLGKALTGGFMSLAATLTTEEIAQAINSPQGGGALMHGPTFMANPLACAVAKASVELFAQNQWQAQVARIEQQLQQGLAGIHSPAVADVRVLGAIGVVELKEDIDMAMVSRVCLAQGVWLRPFGTLIYTMPPFISTHEQVEKIITAIQTLIKEHEKMITK